MIRCSVEQSPWSLQESKMGSMFIGRQTANGGISQTTPPCLHLKDATRAWKNLEVSGPKAKLKTCSIQNKQSEVDFLSELMLLIFLFLSSTFLLADFRDWESHRRSAGGNLWSWSAHGVFGGDPWRDYSWKDAAHTAKPHVVRLLGFRSRPKKNMFFFEHVDSARFGQTGQWVMLDPRRRKKKKTCLSPSDFFIHSSMCRRSSIPKSSFCYILFKMFETNLVIWFSCMACCGNLQVMTSMVLGLMLWLRCWGILQRIWEGRAAFMIMYFHVEFGCGDILLFIFLVIHIQLLI